jgi:uncharacterized membrane protein YjgN (DUF898 family)
MPPGGGFPPQQGGGYAPGPQPGWGQQPQQPQGYPAPGGYQPAPGPYAGPGAGPYAAPMGAPQGEVRLTYVGTGGELFGQLFVGMLLMMVTLGIYGPWFVCRMLNYYSSKTSAGPTARGNLQFEFRGSGGSLFGVMIVGYLLTMITLGIYFPWFICKLTRYFTDNLVARSADGTQYQLKFNGEGGALFGTWLLGAILSVITLYIYLPWFMCNVRKFFYQNTQILENGQPVGQLDFVGDGASLLGTFIVGVLLTWVTAGIYFSWFKVNLMKFWARNTRINLKGQVYHSDFTGTGGDLFVTNLVGMLLTFVTLGIYWFWFQTKMMKFNLENTVFRPGMPVATT